MAEDKVTTERKERTGLPQVNMLDAISYTKKAYELIGTNLKSFSGLAGAMGISQAFAKKAFGELRSPYGLIEQEGNGWKVSDLGRRAAKGEKNAVIEILEKSPILKTLYKELKDKQYDKDYVEDYIKKKRFAYNINISLVAERFIGAVDYINSLEEGGNEHIKSNVTSLIDNELSIDIIKLKYAISPPGKKEISELISKLHNKSKEIEDTAIKSLIEEIFNNKDNEMVLNALMNSLIKIISNKSPSFPLNKN